MPCCEPTVTTTSSGWAWMPSNAITSQIRARSAGSPCADPYCNARGPSAVIRSAISERSSPEAGPTR